ncbi:MAG: CvpA family protein [Peptostreptococcaceae bacterium]|nr:CvpA family protein [Peptostreptococcaceae bacterium]
MILDIIIILIMLISAFIGKKTGIATTIINLIKWLAVIILGILLTGPIKIFLIEHTTIDDWLNTKLGESLVTTTTLDLPGFLPNAMSNGIDNVNESLSYSVSNSIVGVFMTLIALLIVIIIIGIITAVLSSLFSKKHNKGNLIGTTDGFIGLFFGLARGALIVFIFLAVLVPIAAIFFQEQIPSITDSLNSSIVAGKIYDNNPLLVLLDRILGE